jgi:hypothetical protein
MGPQEESLWQESSWKGTYTGALSIWESVASIAYYTGPQAADYTKQILDSYSQDLVEDHALWGSVAFVIHVVAASIRNHGVGEHSARRKTVCKTAASFGCSNALKYRGYFLYCSLGWVDTPTGFDVEAALFLCF